MNNILVPLMGRYSNPFSWKVKPWDFLERALADHRGLEKARKPYERVPRLTPEQIEKLVVRYNEIRSMREVAREFRLDRSTVREHLRRSGITVRTTHSMKHRQKELAKKLYHAGFSSAYIGKRLKFDNKTVTSELRKMGVEIRPQIGRGRR